VKRFGGRKWTLHDRHTINSSSPSTLLLLRLFVTRKIPSRRPQMLFTRVNGSGRRRSTPFYYEKVANVRAATAGAPPPTFSSAPSGCSLSAFSTLSIAYVTTATRRLADKQCANDPLPTRLLTEKVDLLAPFITELFNKSVTSGTLPEVFKSTYYHTASEESRKILGRIGQFRTCRFCRKRSSALSLISCWITSIFGDCYETCNHHSKETTVLRVLSDIPDLMHWIAVTWTY